MFKHWFPSAAVILVGAATLFNSGCSSSDLTGPPTTGSLQVTVTGLPTGTMASVIVSGPGGFKQLVTASQRLSNLRAGTYTITAANVVVANATYGATPSSITVTVVASTTPARAAVAYARISGSTTLTVSGLPCRVVVTAEDASGNIYGYYSGTVHFTSTDPAAVLPPDYTFVSADTGSHTFPITLTTPGSQAVTATDFANSLLGSEVAIVPGRSCTQPLYVSDGGTIKVFAAGATGNATPMSQIVTGRAQVRIAGNGAGLLYAAYHDYLRPGPDSVVVYALGAMGNLSTKSVIAGNNTGLNLPSSIAVDGAGQIYVASGPGSAITVYAAGATGNATPVATLAGSNTGLTYPTSIALNAAGQLYVANFCAQSSATFPGILVFAAGARGNAAPVATINLFPFEASGMTLDPAGRLYASNGFNRSSDKPCASYPPGSPSVTVYAPGATGNVTPIATIAGNNTGLVDPVDVAVDANGWLYVLDGSTGAILIYPPGATGNVAPTATIAGGHTGISQPSELTF